jgi:hypothetical protein
MVFQVWPGGIYTFSGKPRSIVEKTVDYLVSKVGVGYLIDIGESQGYVKEVSAGVRKFVWVGVDFGSQVASRAFERAEDFGLKGKDWHRGTVKRRIELK